MADGPVAEQLLARLEAADGGLDSAEVASQLRVEHQVVVGAVKSLQALGQVAGNIHGNMPGPGETGPLDVLTQNSGLARRLQTMLQEALLQTMLQEALLQTMLQEALLQTMLQEALLQTMLQEALLQRLRTPGTKPASPGLSLPQPPGSQPRLLPSVCCRRRPGQGKKGPQPFA